MAISTILSVASSLSKFVPILGDLFSKDESVAEKIVDIAEAITGKNGSDAVAMIESDANIALEFKKAVLTNSTIESKLEVKRLQIINKTMQIEANSDNWWTSSWRPFIGYITGVSFLLAVCFVCFLTYEAIISKNGNYMQMMPQIIFNLTTLFGVPGAILGIASHHRGKEKICRAKEK